MSEMGRLIDADRLRQEMMESHRVHGDTSVLISALERDIRILDEQPTVYDVDKVVKKIQELGTRFCTKVGCDTKCKNCEHAAIMSGVVDIVKRGGMDD